MKLGMCLDSDAPGSAGLGQKALNAMNPRRGRNAKDAAIRFRKALQLLSESIVLPGQIEPDAIEILNPGPAPLGTSISRKDFDRIAEKIVRGITWVVNQKLVDACYEIRVSSSPKPNPEFDAIVIQNGSRYDRGPGIVVYYAKATDDPIAAFFLVRLFDQIDLRATIAPTGANARPQP